jgi:NTE family protein
MPNPDLRTEPKLALALGGGGALGAAHIGVLQVLRERDIHPSMVAGTSAGSVAGAGYALRISPYELERMVRRATWGSFGAITRSRGIGVLDTEGVRASIERILGQDINIEDMPTPFAAVATDVDTREVVVLKSGSLADAVRASIAVPGLFKPVRIGKRLLVDGGVMQNLPIEAAFNMGAHHVIGVRIAAEWEILPQFRTSSRVHGMEIRNDVTIIAPELGNRSQWIPRDIPTLVRLGREAAERTLADYPVVVEPPERDLDEFNEPEPTVRSELDTMVREAAEEFLARLPRVSMPYLPLSHLTQQPRPDLSRLPRPDLSGFFRRD